MEISYDLTTDIEWNQEVIEISVKDTGSGMDEKTKRQLFKLFGTNELNRGGKNQHGVGLGLTMSKQLVSVLGPADMINVSSEVLKGSTFDFKLWRSLNSFDKSSAKPESNMDRISPTYSIKMRKMVKERKSLSVVKHMESKESKA